jgi:hypothetical protein
MWALLLQAVLAQAPAPPTQAVVVRFSRGQEYPKEKGLALAGRIAAILQYGGVSLALKPDEAEHALAVAGKSADACRGNRGCLADLGVLLHAGVVIAVEAGQVRSDLAIHVEALSADASHRPLASDSFVVSESVGDTELQGKLGAFTRALLAQLGARAPDAPVADARTTRGGPVDARPPWELLDAAPPPGRPTGVYVCGGAALAGGITAGVLGLVGLSRQGDYNSHTEPGPSAWTQSQASSAASQINGLYTGALVAAIVAAGLGAATGVWWSQTGSPSQ